MTSYTNDANQTGLALGTTVTTGNSGGGTNTAFSVVNGTVTIDNSSPVIGTKDYQVAATTGTKGDVVVTVGSTTSAAARLGFTLTGLPSGTIQWLTILTAGANYVGMNSSGKLFVTVNNSVVYTSTVTLSLNTLYRTEFGVTIAASGATVNWALYAGLSNTPLDSYTSTTANTGTTAITGVGFGKATTSGNMAAFTVGALAINNASAALIGPPASPPTASFTDSEVALAMSVDGTGSTAAPPATISSYSWDWGDSTSLGSGSTASHTYAAGGTYTVVLTVTDSNGLTGTASRGITVVAPAGTVTVQSVDVSTGWTASSGTILACLTDADGTTFASASNPTAQEFDFTLQAVIPPASGQPFKVFVDIDATLLTSGTFNAQLFEGSTQRSSLSGNVIPSGSGSTVSHTVTLSFPWSDVQNVTTGGWNALKVKLQVTAS